VTHTSPPAWGADPSIAWRILLTAVPTAASSVTGLSERQETLHRDQDWPAPPPVETGDEAALRHALAEVRDAPLVLGLAGDRLVISAFHAYVDGLGLLEVLAALTGGPVTTSARGLADRPAEGAGVAGRLREMAVAPPARVAPTAVRPADGDAFAALTLPGRVRTADLVHAAASAVVRHNEDAGRPARHVTVAVGAGRPAAEGERLANRSELLRLRDVEDLTRSEVADALRTSHLSAAGGSGTRDGLLNKAALRLLAPRLGSTLLVSHLGDVTTTAASDLAFYPVTAGGSGISLGAVGHGGRTVLTLRARAASWDAAGLTALLTRVAGALPS
jgi:hypothetical protein